MNKFLLIDFGASFVKSCFYYKNSDTYSEERSMSAPSIIDGEISIDSILSAFKSIADGSDYDAILMSSQMHGFSLKRDGKFLTNYITWMKQFPSKSRHIYTSINGVFDWDGIPINNIQHFIEVYDDATMVSLPEIFGDSTCVHNTLFCGNGFYDVQENKVSEKIWKDVCPNVKFNKVCTEPEVAGMYNGKPIFCGFGDLQCAVYGSELQENQLSINIGTGSQVSMVSSHLSNLVENRSYFHGKLLNTITHIPSGRLINTLTRFLNSIHNQDYHSFINQLTVEQVKRSDLSIDLTTFYFGGTEIGNVNERNFDLTNLCASLIREMGDHYVSIINSCFRGKYDSVVMTGGISQKIPALTDYISEKLGIDSSVKWRHNISNSLAGLGLIASEL